MVKNYSEYLKEGNKINESINLLEMYLMWMIVDQLSDVPKEEWVQYLSETPRNIFMDFILLLKQYGYPVDENVIKDKFDSLMKSVIEKLQIGVWKENGFDKKGIFSTKFH